MKPKRIAVLDLSALARLARGSPESDDLASDERGSTPSHPSWARCGTELDHEAHCAALDNPADDDSDSLAIEIALDWVRTNREQTRRTAFERSLLRTLQARLRRNGLRAARRSTRSSPPAPRRRRG